MNIAATLHEALLFTVAGGVLALVMMRWKPESRPGLIPMLSIMAIGVAGLAALARFGVGLEGTKAGIALREACLAIATIGFIRILLAFVFQGLLAQMTLPRILGDVIFALSLAVYAIYRMDALGVNLAGIVTTSAILGTGVALSLREPLTNLWGGLALQLDNTYRIGDWVRVEGAMGQVVGIRWRYTSLATNSGETLIIPNSTLIRNRVHVLARRGDLRIPWRRPVEISVGYEWPPSRVIEVIEAALARADMPNVARAPAPSCICSSFETSSIKYVVRYWLTDLSLDDLTDSVVRLHAFAGLSREGMDVPITRAEIFWHPASDVRAEEAVREREARVALLVSLELFRPLTDPERKALSSELKPVPFVTGDTITREGEPAESLYILARGQVGIFRDAPQPAESPRQRLATLSAPGYFGEMGLLTGQARTATVVAEREVLCYRLDKPGFEAILKARPELAEGLSQTLAARQAANDATLASLSAEARARATGSRASDLVQKIRQFFGM
ncbi:MAG TPA: mechanosensitive ion channel family protein [Casimicrobiaceae bacterium]|jgi:small-conductance mechanosensitive channel/CRP-like cAMP-binding protein